MNVTGRRQNLIQLIKKQPTLRVPEIADRLGVSQGTVRNDLNALAEAGQLARVHGGAILLRDGQPHSPSFILRAQVNEPAKLQIACRAAEQVEDGDTILLDASTTVYSLARFLQDRRNLTVVTNGVEVARSLAQNPTNTVILLGGIMRPDGTSVSGPLSDRLLQDLHIQRAFVSCTAFSLHAGLTEVDIDEAHLKRKMIGVASSVVALIDSSKFGKVDLTPFARAEQIAALYTDSGLDPVWIQQLRQTCMTLTVCGEQTISTYTPCSPEARPYRIGFANLSEQSTFAIDVRRGLERAAAAAGKIDLVLADNQLSAEVALEVAERFSNAALDLVIEYQIDAQASARIMDRFRQAGIPVIAVDIPVVGATYFGVDNYRAGYLAGEALGAWIRSHWEADLDHLIILEEPRAGAQPAARIQGQLDGLEALIGNVPAEKRMALNSGNISQVSEARMLEALAALPQARRLAVICINDESALGALDAARRVGRAEDVVIVGQGADRRMRAELLRPGTRIVGSTAFFPELYGEKVISLALQILRGEPIPPAVYMEHVFVPAGPGTVAVAPV